MTYIVWSCGMGIFQDWLRQEAGRRQTGRERKEEEHGSLYTSQKITLPTLSVDKDLGQTGQQGYSISPGSPQIIMHVTIYPIYKSISNVQCTYAMPKYMLPNVLPKCRLRLPARSS